VKVTRVVVAGQSEQWTMPSWFRRNGVPNSIVGHKIEQTF